MCFLNKAPAVTMPAIPPVAAAPTQRDANLAANLKRQQRAPGTNTDATGGLGDPSLAPVTKSTLGA